MKLEAYTDASWKNGVSTHHWRLVTESGWVKKRRSFKATEDSCHLAELHTIVSLVQYLNKKDITDLTIYTDSQYVVNLLNGNSNKEETNLVKALRWDLKGLNLNVEWVSRSTKQIKMADYYCGELLETVFKRKEFQQELEIN